MQTWMGRIFEVGVFTVFTTLTLLKSFTVFVATTFCLKQVSITMPLFVMLLETLTESLFNVILFQMLFHSFVCVFFYILTSAFSLGAFPLLIFKRLMFWFFFSCCICLFSFSCFALSEKSTQLQYRFPFVRDIECNLIQ